MAREIPCDFCGGEEAIGMISMFGADGQTTSFGAECRLSLLGALAQAWGLVPDQGTESTTPDGAPTDGPGVDDVAGPPPARRVAPRKKAKDQAAES